MHEKEKNRLLKKGDIAMMAIALISVLILCGMNYHQKQGDTVCVTINGEKKNYALSENQTIEVFDGSQCTNEIVIQDGTVYMQSADCPDQICVRHKAIYRNGESIVCLPNKVYIQVESGQEKEIDN